MMRIFLFIFFTLVFSTSPVFAEQAPSAPALKTIHMKIQGMTCSMCSAGLKKKLAALCASSSVNHATGEGVCTYDPTKTTQEAVVETVADAGYKVTEVK